MFYTETSRVQFKNLKLISLNIYGHISQIVL